MKSYSAYSSAMTKKQATEVALEAILAKRDRLLAERKALRLKAAELAARDRYIDRELADCKAAARVFDLEISFQEEKSWEGWQTNLDKNKDLIPASGAVLQKRDMPKLRDIVLDCLRLAGERGSKAAPIQEYVETTYATKIHQKTIGLTLYRLLRQGLVRRNGHTWFFVSQTTAGKDSGISGVNP